MSLMSGLVLSFQQVEQISVEGGEELSFWDRLLDSLEQVGTTIGDYAPKILGALIILIVGWFIVRILKKVTFRLLDSSPVKVVLDKARISGALEGSGYNAASLGATVVYLFLWLFVLLITFETLGAETFVDLVERAISWLPLVLMAFLIVVLITAVGNVVAELVTPWSKNQGVTWLPMITRAGFILFGVATALDLLNIGIFVNIVTASILGGVGAAFAIAFGVGGIDTAKKWWAKYLSPGA
ncbi:MAG: hypothetical protein IH941_06740 [Acidobacteria bacterium]|nr:hypothetical protein [Acidobacteriota bacterium]